MIIYEFECVNKHKQTKNWSSEDLDANVDVDNENRFYIECNVHYGDLEHPRCEEKAYLTPVV
jgi:hypothetical protein